MATEDKEMSFLGMSDEELMNVDPSTFGQQDTDEEATPEAQEEAATEEVSNPQEGETESDDHDDSDRNEETDEGQAAAEEGTEGLLTEESDPGVENAGGKKERTQEQKTPESDAAEDTEDTFDYKAAYQKLTAPFKANGRDIAVKDVDDAISLMQMGANYNKKMAALKPNLKLLKLLENNGLLSEEKIGFLIDLEKKNPEAITKLVKDSGLDPMEMDTEKAGDYKPGKHTVDDRELELDRVLDEIQGTTSYNQTLHIVSNEWDGPSKQVIANSPQLLKVINSHVQSGIYDLISKEIESERMFGRLEGLSDIEAYRQVGDAIQARGGFNHLSAQGNVTQPKPVIVQPKPKKVDDDKLREKKRAAGSSKPAGASQVSEDFNPLALSDDAFSKLINEKYL